MTKNAILIAKLPKRTFVSEDGEFNLYLMRMAGGHWGSAVYIGTDAPKPMKTVEYQLHGEWYTDRRGKDQFRIHAYKRYVKPDHLIERAIVRDAEKRL